MRNYSKLYIAIAVAIAIVSIRILVNESTLNNPALLKYLILFGILMFGSFMYSMSIEKIYRIQGYELSTGESIMMNLLPMVAGSKLKILHYDEMDYEYEPPFKVDSLLPILSLINIIGWIGIVIFEGFTTQFAMESPKVLLLTLLAMTLSQYINALRYRQLAYIRWKLGDYFDTYKDGANYTFSTIILIFITGLVVAATITALIGINLSIKIAYLIFMLLFLILPTVGFLSIRKIDRLLTIEENANQAKNYLSQTGLSIEDLEARVYKNKSTTKRI